MCNHRYVANYSGKPRAMTDRACPYPELFARTRDAIGEPGETGPALPVDAAGACIFHSRDLEWKRKNGFGEAFSRLLERLDADEGTAWYDFCEFVFVGDRPGSGAESEGGAVPIQNRVFAGAVYLIGATFVDPLEIRDVDFRDTVSFLGATFEQDLRVDDTRFRVLELTQVEVKRRALFTNVEFLNFALFHHSRFSGRTERHVVRFRESRFRQITDFSEIEFNHGGASTVMFDRVDFEDMLDFTGTNFDCHLCFDRVSFADTVDFVDTSFGMVTSAARYRGAAVEFNRIEVRPKAVVTFKSNDPRKKLFDHDVQMSFEGEPEGIVRFENVNFSKLTPGARGRLMRLEPSGRVEIGPGCIKYRHQTDLRSIPVTHDNAPLVLELCQTFSNYFTGSHGLNLGFEVVERSSERISFFYFSDEGISEQEFLERLGQTERDLWNLLSVRSTGQLPGRAPSADERTTLDHRRAAINAVDGISALIGTFFRAGARIAVGHWTPSDTKALLGAIRFNEEGADERAENLHRVLEERYTGRVLVGINSRQHEPLSVLIPAPRKALPPERVRILFLGADSSISPLDLDAEVTKIETDLKQAKERDRFELRQIRAVTVDNLMQAMLDESPTIVHFSGHGDTSGIYLQDDRGRPRLVSEKALSGLFELFKDRVRCVVLNSCYSEHQARAIRRHIRHVVGMGAGLPETAALAFSAGFYKAIGAGEDVPFAFHMGRAALELEGISEQEHPVML